jgi:hypothetical protein
MSEFVNLKSIDLSSITIIGTVINVIYAIIFTIIFLIMGGISAGTNILGTLLMIAPTIIFGTMIITMFQIFTRSYIYNLLASKLENIKLNFVENKEIKEISPLPTAVILTIISTIMFIIFYLTNLIIVQIIFSTVYQILMIAGNISLVYGLYQAIYLMSDPIIIILAIIFVVIATFILTLISCYLYNLLTSKMYGVMLGLEKENNMTVINSINPVNAALILSIIGLIIGLIYGIIILATTHNLYAFIASILNGFIGTFLCVLITSYLYNLLAPKFGAIKIELTDVVESNK